MRINLRLIALYGFLLSIAYLTGSYFGSFMLVLFWLLLLYPVLSVAVLCIGLRRLRVAQGFSGESAVRGEAVRFRVRIANRSFLPISRVTACTRARTPLADVTAGRVFSLGPFETVEWEESYHFPYRGVYELGMESLEVSDLMRFVTFALPARRRTFRIYPRLFAANGFSLQAASPDGQRSATQPGGSPDPTLFSRVREYMSGEPIRHIYWKKFASYGVPLLKEYEGALMPSFTIYPDLRRPDTPGADPREQEDSTLEILLSLARHLLERGVGLRIAAPGLQFSAATAAGFSSLYERSVDLEFRSTLSPAAVHRADQAESWKGTGSAILLTHRLDAQILDHLESAARTGEPVTLILNQAGHPADLKGMGGRIAQRIRRWGLIVLTVEGASSLAGIPPALSGPPGMRPDRGGT